MPVKPGHRALRKGRVSLPGQIYLLTIVTLRREPIFLDTALARAVSRCMMRDCWGDAHLLCWVLMPDHWHGLVRLGERDGLSLLINRMKSVTAKRSHTASEHARIWARGFHDRALRCDEDQRAAARYIVANPVRAGLVQHVCDYPYWDCTWL
jgi:REP element-mobilizing transposase RayT